MARTCSTIVAAARISVAVACGGGMIVMWHLHDRVLSGVCSVFATTYGVAYVRD